MISVDLQSRTPTGLVSYPSPPPLYFVFENSKYTRNELARPVMGTIFLVIINMDTSPDHSTPARAARAG